MSNANKLREAIEKVLEHPDIVVLMHKPVHVDAILQAIEDELPEERIGTEKMPLDSAERGYNIAIQDVKSLLASARSGASDE